MTIWLLSLLLIIAVVTDGHSQKIPNILTGPGLLAGLTLSVADPHGGIGILNAISGMAVGFIILFPGYCLGKVGAGDVKLLAMAGSFLGFQAIADAGLLTMIAGGLMAGIWLLAQRYLPLRSVAAVYQLNEEPVDCLEIGVKKTESVWQQRFPYALAIALGCYGVMYTSFSVFAVASA